MQKPVDILISDMSNRIESVNENLLLSGAAVRQAISSFKDTLEQLESLIDKDDISGAAKLGYETISSDYVFLQRLLGSAQEADLEKVQIIQDLASQSTGVYEEAASHIEKIIKSLREE